MSTWLELKRYLLEIASCVGQFSFDVYNIHITNAGLATPPSCESEMKENLYFVC
jgi:hypothetical protein